jgi:hypothetical protein
MGSSTTQTDKNKTRPEVESHPEQVVGAFPRLPAPRQTEPKAQPRVESHLEEVVGALPRLPASAALVEDAAQRVDVHLLIDTRAVELLRGLEREQNK